MWDMLSPPPVQPRSCGRSARIGRISDATRRRRRKWRESNRLLSTTTHHYIRAAGVPHDVTTTECDYFAASSSKLAAANIDENKMSGEKARRNWIMLKSSYTLPSSTEKKLHRRGSVEMVTEIKSEVYGRKMTIIDNAFWDISQTLNEKKLKKYVDGKPQLTGCNTMGHFEGDAWESRSPSLKSCRNARERRSHCNVV